MINLIRNRINKSDHILFEFNPWKYSSTSLQIKFFEELLERLGSRKSILSYKLERYSKKINETNTGQIGTIFNVLKELFRPSKSTEELLMELNEEITYLNKQLFIVIDDLDRLHNEELFEVLKIIRSTANFPNTVYLIAYDRTYIDKSLEFVNSYGAYEYLEKIVNLEIVLPGVRNGVLQNILINELKKYSNENELSILSEAIKGTFSKSSSFIKNSLKSIRHVKRIVNSYALNTVNLKGEVDVADFLILELIRSCYPSVYTIFQKKYIEYLEYKDTSDKLIGVYQLKSIKDNDRAENSDLEKAATSLIELDWIRTNNGITKNDILWVREAFNLLFPYSSAGKSKDSICFSNRTERYLSYSLAASELSRADFESTLKLDFDPVVSG